MIDGVVRSPSEFSMTLTSLPSMTATQEFVVPRSMPIILPMFSFPSFRGPALRGDRLPLYWRSPQNFNAASALLRPSPLRPASTVHSTYSPSAIPGRPTPVRQSSLSTMLTASCNFGIERLTDADRSARCPPRASMSRNNFSDSSTPSAIAAAAPVRAIGARRFYGAFEAVRDRK